MKARAQVLATSSPLALKLKEAYDGDLEHADAGLPETQLPVCVMLGLLRLESALLSPDVPLGFGDAPLFVCGHSAGFLAAACVALDAEDPFAHAGDAIRMRPEDRQGHQCVGYVVCSVVTENTSAVAAMKVRSQTKVQLGLVNAPSSCVLTGAIQEFVDCVPKTVKLPIRWPVHSSLLDEAKAGTGRFRTRLLGQTPALCRVITGGRRGVFGAAKGCPWHINKPAGGVAVGLGRGASAAAGRSHLFGDSYGLLAWHPTIGSKRTYQMKSADGSFAVKIRAARDDEEEPVVEEEDQEDDSMALFAKKNKKRKDVDAAENMQGHAYFAAMLGILLPMVIFIRYRARAILPPRSRGPVCSNYTRIWVRGLVYFVILCRCGRGRRAVLLEARRRRETDDLGDAQASRDGLCHDGYTYQPHPCHLRRPIQKHGLALGAQTKEALALEAESDAHEVVRGHFGFGEVGREGCIDERAKSTPSCILSMSLYH